jgi:hypothetical protein
VKDPNKEFFRLDDWQIETYEKVIVPTREIQRHFDGYSHVGMDPTVCPPIEIPPGFFEKNLVIRYGFNDYDPSCVNINPLSPSLHAVDIKSADYKFMLNDIPMFWKPFIKRIEISTTIDHPKMLDARNQYYKEVSSPFFSGKKMEIPESWIENHLI